MAFVFAKGLCVWLRMCASEGNKRQTQRDSLEVGVMDEAQGGGEDHGTKRLEEGRGYIADP